MFIPRRNGVFGFYLDDATERRGVGRRQVHLSVNNTSSVFARRLFSSNKKLLSAFDTQPFEYRGVLLQTKDEF